MEQSQLPSDSSLGKTLAISALIAGLASIPFTLCCGVFAFPIPIVALILGIIALGKINTGTASGREMAIIGIVLGAVGLVFWFGILVLLGFLSRMGAVQDSVSYAAPVVPALARCLPQPEHSITPLLSIHAFGSK